ncbi:MAG: hypothetical protein V9F01_13230 [Chitinophagaceae bacterium]
MKNGVSLDNLRSEYQQIQRSQFDAEKRVAVADTSVQNLQRYHQPDRRRKEATRRATPSS